MLNQNNQHQNLPKLNQLLFNIRQLKQTNILYKQMLTNIKITQINKNNFHQK